MKDEECGYCGRLIVPGMGVRVARPETLPEGTEYDAYYCSEECIDLHNAEDLSITGEILGVAR